MANLLEGKQLNVEQTWYEGKSQRCSVETPKTNNIHGKLILFIIIILKKERPYNRNIASVKYKKKQ